MFLATLCTQLFIFCVFCCNNVILWLWRMWPSKLWLSTLKITFIFQRQRPNKLSCLLWFQTALNGDYGENGRGYVEGEVSAKSEEWERQVHCLLLHPSVVKVQVESYSLSSVCEERGGQEERKGSKKKGVERWKGRDGKGKGRGDSWWSLLKGIVGEERIAMAAM